MQLFGLFFRRLPYPSISHSLPVFSNVCLVVSVNTVLKVWVHCFIFYLVFNASQTCELNNDKQQGTKKKVFVFSQTSTTRSQETQTNNEPLRPGTEKKTPKSINVQGWKGRRENEEECACHTAVCPLYQSSLCCFCVCVLLTETTAIILVGEETAYSLSSIFTMYCTGTSYIPLVQWRKRWQWSWTLPVSSLFIYAPWVYQLLEMNFFFYMLRVSVIKRHADDEKKK